MPLAVIVPLEATPPAMVATIGVFGLRDAPAAGGVKVTRPPSTGSAALLATRSGGHHQLFDWARNDTGALAEGCAGGEYPLVNNRCLLHKH